MAERFLLGKYGRARITAGGPFENGGDKKAILHYICNTVTVHKMYSFMFMQIYNLLLSNNMVLSTFFI